MTRKNILKKIVRDNLKAIEDNLNAYEKVDATLSETTLFSLATYLDISNQVLEKGFVKDACDEIDEILSVS